MKDLRNKSGVLPAQFTNSRVDCGIAWSEHRRVERAKREDVIAVDPAEQCSDQTAVATFRMKPIDPATIQVGDTVRLVGSRTVTCWPKCNLEVGEDYKVKVVDSRCADGMSVGLYLDEFSKPFWIYDDDLMLVEPA
jgi:hypothetical protein